jgi:endonuclease/exonuclease/phosphatase family metal-dependent hydrolase
VFRKLLETGRRPLAGVLAAIFLPVFAAFGTASSDSVVVASYNLENWLTMERFVDGNRVPSLPKPDHEKAAAVEILASIKPDILGVVEIGSLEDLRDLRARLKAAGLDYPHFEWHDAEDPVRHVALLSRFPIVARNSKKGIVFQVDGSMQPMARGILDVTVEITPQYSLRLIGLHLKSKRPVPEFDQAALRAKEATHVRGLVEEILNAEPKTNLMIFGDLNDTRNEYPIRQILGPQTSPNRLTDLPLADPQGDRWTHYWQAADIYSRIDYLIVSSALLPEIQLDHSGINRAENWSIASDHRVIFTKLTPVER